MLTKNASITREATPSDLQKLANLIHFEAHIHRHLDYRPPLDWVGNPPFLILENNSSIAAALACPPDPPEVAWIRLFAASTRVQTQRAWEVLWAETHAYFRTHPYPRWIAAIPIHPWFENLLISSAFEWTHNITMLSWESQLLGPAPVQSSVSIRPMTLDDLGAVQRVDASSFTPIWQNSLPYLELAYRQATIASVAEKDGHTVGYQISTTTPLGGHLARLAVDPRLQGQGIGHLLLHDLLSQFIRRGANIVTVNTQKENAASLALYQGMGFKFSGEEYPVYQMDLSAPAF